MLLLLVGSETSSSSLWLASTTAVHAASEGSAPILLHLIHVHHGWLLLQVLLLVHHHVGSRRHCHHHTVRSLLHVMIHHAGLIVAVYGHRRRYHLVWLRRKAHLHLLLQRIVLRLRPCLSIPHLIENCFEHLWVRVFHEEADLGMFLCRLLVNSLLQLHLVVLVLRQLLKSLVPFKICAVHCFLLGLLALIFRLIEAYD